MTAEHINETTRQTPFHNEHVKLGGQMVPFAGWSMPLHYGSQLKEHEAVRQNAGMFDVSHMAIADIKGPDAYEFLHKVLANDVAKLKQGGALYGCMLNEKGGIIDDLITYKMDDDHYRVVVNAATTTKDMRWLEDKTRGFNTTIELMSDLALMAIQGPNARQLVKEVLGGQEAKIIDELEPFHFGMHKNFMIARTGYTGEDGLEIAALPESLIELWQSLYAKGVQPAGLGARDTLRLEAGLNLYGTDMDETTTPYESNLGWTVDLKDDARDFYGKDALLAQKQAGVPNKLIAIVLEGQGVIRGGMKVELPSGEQGVVTSGSFSPLMKTSIAFARVPNVECDKVHVDIRGKSVTAKCVKPPFVRFGKICVA